MKTTTLHFNAGFLAVLVAAFFFSVFSPSAAGQFTPEDDWSIPLKGLHGDHQGLAAWDADGTGPEPYGVGHIVPLPGFGHYPFYGASCDYDGIDPDPDACLAHVEGTINGFPAFQEAMDNHNIDPARITLKTGICDLGDDLEGHDWFIIENYTHALYFDMQYRMYLDDELLMTWHLMNADNYSRVGWSYFIVESSFAAPEGAWGPNASQAAKDVGQALLNDCDGQEITVILYLTDAQGAILGNGRNGGFWNVISGTIAKGRPELPYAGMASEHQGMAGWNADGNGPEPAADGHGQQRYYIASRDYDEIDSSANAAFGHLLPDMKGFLNLELQLAYRGYEPGQVLIKNGLSSLGNDEMGKDWGFANGTDYWCHYYDVDYFLELDEQRLITGLVDTSLSWMNPSPAYWWCEATYDLPRDGSELSSEDVQIIAGAFMKDLEGRKMINDLQMLTYDTASFEGNGRYDGGFFNVESARLVAKYHDGCTFVQCDSLCTGFMSSTHWIQAHSPYFIDNNILIDQGHTLRIDSGVVVAFRGPYNFNVKGSITAPGTPGKNILFTRSNPLQEWNSLTFDAPPDSLLSNFEHCVFEYSHTTKPFPYNGGGAIGARYFDNLTLKHCIFRNNSADTSGSGNTPSGGALGLWNASPLIEHCTFTGNQAQYGGAIICYAESSPVIRYSLFHGNYASLDAGAISVYLDSYPVLENNTITGNHAGRYGGGLDLYFCHNDSVYLTNNIIYGNHCTDTTVSQQVSFTSGMNKASFKNNDIEGGQAGLGSTGPNVYYNTGNIDANPGFCEPEAFIFTLLSNSPCLAAGLGGTYIGAFDWDCYEGLPADPPQSSVLTIFPNPASGQAASARFSLPEPGMARFEIFSMTGEKIAEPFAGHLAGGDQQVVFSLERLPAGIYMGRLTAATVQGAVKMIILE